MTEMERPQENVRAMMQSLVTLAISAQLQHIFVRYTSLQQ
jgi:hypothetical protein